jgi:hypothetical protein
MEKIDRLGWAGGLCLNSYGLRIGVRVNRPEVPEWVGDCLPPGWKPGRPPYVDHLFSLKVGGATARSSVRQFHLLYGGLTLLARTMDLDQMREVLENELQLLVAELAQDRVFVHAGVVAWDGQAILLPGRSLSGKSTLTAALLRAGATYYSDEFAVLDRRGFVHPFARRMVLREEENGRRRRYVAEEFGSRAGIEPLPVGLVAVTRYRPGSRWRPRTLTPGRAVLALLRHAVPAQSRPEASMSTLRQVALRARTLEGLRGEAEETAARLLAEIQH